MTTTERVADFASRAARITKYADELKSVTEATEYGKLEWLLRDRVFRAGKAVVAGEIEAALESELNVVKVPQLEPSE